MVSPASLANLRPPFQRHNRQPRASAAVLRAITKCRKLAPEMVDFLAQVVRDQAMDTAVRIRAAEILLNKALPSSTVAKSSAQLESGPSCMRIEFVNPKGEYGDPIDVTPTANSHGNGHDR